MRTNVLNVLQHSCKYRARSLSLSRIIRIRAHCDVYKSPGHLTVLVVVWLCVGSRSSLGDDDGDDDGGSASVILRRGSSPRTGRMIL